MTPAAAPRRGPVNAAAPSGTAPSPWPLAAAGAWALLLAAVGPAGTTAQETSEAAFPHDDHAGLFPVCTGCHEGAESGEAEEMHPEPALCVTCHDGRDQDLVYWRGPADRATTLAFDHATHRRAVGEAGEGESPSCSGCHTPEGAPRKGVERAVAGACFGCHAHRGDDHYVDAECSTCHRPLAETRLPRERVEGFPVPSTHDRPEFLALLHGEQVDESIDSCATCHTGEQCADCHVDPEGVEPVKEMPSAGLASQVPALQARYPVPDSHGKDDFLETHGRDLEPAECSTCHTRESCTSCHAEEDAPAALARLPSGDDVEAPGASVGRREPDSHASPWFAEDHEALAAAGERSCTGCHTEGWCVDCHGETDDPGYHPPNFSMQHASRAYGREMECANCHDTSVFCRDCHAQLGMGARGRRGGGFHDREPAWLLRHGQAARQTLESCASCHQQRDCLQCHSETGAFRVSPHGPDFDARRLFDRNPQVCFACHTSDPLDGSRP